MRMASSILPQKEHHMLMRFVSKVALGPKVLSTSCWLWTGGMVRGGYGQFTVCGVTQYAHRWAWEQKHGPIPSGLTIDHLCRTRNCVNPDHMDPVTLRVNTLRGNSFVAVNARKTQCPKEHPYDDDNTYREGGRRHCRECGRASRRAYSKRCREGMACQ